MTNEIAVQLPAEVAQIAESVSVEKRNEVQTVLNQVFEGVSKMRQQLDTVSVADENDRINMKLANTIRLGVRQVRLSAEKTFDAKRAEVQAQMLSFKTEDQLWLKAKQTMQILTKEIEEQARWKEETRDRYEQEQRELKVQQRLVQVAKFDATIQRADIEHMTDQAFDMFLSGVENAYNERIEAERKAESERIAREKAEAEERERIRKENERLKAEAEERERAIEAERKQREEHARKEREAAEKKLREERAAREKLEAEARAKKEAEDRAAREAKQREEAEAKAKAAAERKAKAAPDKVKLEQLAKDIESIVLPELKSEDGQKVLSDVKVLIGKLTGFIREKTSVI
jgi:hypothetical protein